MSALSGDYVVNVETGALERREWWHHGQPLYRSATTNEVHSLHRAQRLAKAPPMPRGFVLVSHEARRNHEYMGHAWSQVVVEADAEDVPDVVEACNVRLLCERWPQEISGRIERRREVGHRVRFIVETIEYVPPGKVYALGRRP